MVHCPGRVAAKAEFIYCATNAIELSLNSPLKASVYGKHCLDASSQRIASSSRQYASETFSYSVLPAAQYIVNDAAILVPDSHAKHQASRCRIKRDLQIWNHGE